MSHFKIHAALDSHLNHMDNKPPIAWDNVAFIPTVGTLWVRPTYLPVATTQAGLGDNGLDEYLAIYQIDIFAPVGKGKFEAEQMAEAITARFARGSALAYDSLSLRIRNTNRLPSQTFDNWYRISIEINLCSFNHPIGV
jgi:hypothetical protein